MKFTNKIVAGIFCAGLLTAAIAQSTSAPAKESVKFDIPNVAAPAAAAAPAAPAAPAVKFTEQQLLEVYGYMLGARMGVAELEFTPAQIEAISRGMTMVASGKTPAVDAQAIGPELEAFLAKKQQAFMSKVRNRNLSDAAAYFTKLKENKAVVELPSGLRYEIIKAGTGAAPKAGQVAKIHYTGSFISGQVFDSSVQRGEPIELLVQAPSKEDPRGAISGMVEGLQKMNVGGKYKLYIPPHLAYGDEGSQGIPPAATLIFEVELLDAKDAPKEAAPAPAAK